jgi:hypothetical protein
MRPHAFKLALTLAAAAALLALAGAGAGAAARAQYAPAVGRQSDYSPTRAGFLLRGPVRTVKEEDYNLHADGSKVFTGNMTFHFDERGRLVRLLRGNDQSEDLYDHRFSYREDGRVASQERLYERRLESTEMYVYADDRREVEVLTYNRDGALVMRDAKSFDERGGETRSEMEFYARQGEGAPDKSVREMTHTYDEKGGLVGTAVKGAAGGPEVRVARRREAGGRLVTTTKQMKDGKETTFDTTVTTEDERGELLSTETYGADGRLASKVTCERKYDARGNWVEELVRTREYKEPRPQESAFLRRRAITYF